MACRQCEGIEAFFDDGVARRELRRYRRKGVGGTTRILLEALRSPSAGTGVAGRSFLDIGGGVGAIQHELMAAGATHGTHADASPAYLDAARSEGERRGHADRVRYVLGDFVDVADDIEPADVVTLDRVVCCYPDMPALVDASASRALESYGLVFPRVTPLTR
ncbi:MAG: class I SAM-dependent methyltransferase, partial [Gemmatimonadota bacterium]|nr:class I SAM-dependent methyltransferase [Gemmatimonadota bacterium]